MNKDILFPHNERLFSKRIHELTITVAILEKELNNKEIDVEHSLFALLIQDHDIIKNEFTQHNIGIESIKDKLLRKIKHNKTIKPEGNILLSQGAITLIDDAVKKKNTLHDKALLPENTFLALFDEKYNDKSPIMETFSKINIIRNLIIKEILSYREGSSIQRKG
jgi:ATP-dependent Clp protease ATP-binding subunit ClpA